MACNMQCNQADAAAERRASAAPGSGSDVRSEGWQASAAGRCSSKPLTRQ